MVLLCSLHLGKGDGQITESNNLKEETIIISVSDNCISSDNFALLRC